MDCTLYNIFEQCINGIRIHQDCRQEATTSANKSSSRTHLQIRLLIKTQANICHLDIFDFCGNEPALLTPESPKINTDLMEIMKIAQRAECKTPTCAMPSLKAHVKPIIDGSLLLIIAHLNTNPNHYKSNRSLLEYCDIIIMRTRNHHHASDYPQPAITPQTNDIVDSPLRIGDRVLCSYGANYYTATILQFSTDNDGLIYKVHYATWKYKTWAEWVPLHRLRNPAADVSIIQSSDIEDDQP